MGPRIFAALGDRGGPTICRLNTAGETRPLVSSSSFSRSLFSSESRARFTGYYLDILEEEIKKVEVFRKVTNGRIPTEFELCQTNRRSVSNGSRLVVRMLNVVGRTSSRVMSCGRQGIRCLASPRSLQTLEPRSTTDKPCATISRPGFVSTLRVICEIDRIMEYFGKEGRFDRIFSNASSDPLTATHKR